jgi:hypothetical protein
MSCIKTCFSFKKLFSRFSAAFVQNRRPYGRKFYRPTIFFFLPVVSYFAEFLAGWQQWTEWLGGGGRGPQTLLPVGQKFGQITQNQPNKKMIGRENLAAVRPPILDKSGPRK